MRMETAGVGPLKESMEKGMARIKKLHSQGASGRVVVEARTALVDGLIRDLYRGVEKNGQGPLAGGAIARGGGQCALIALGGYGRAELNPHSDIDLLFLHDGGMGEDRDGLVNPVLYVLWDLGLDVGHSIRTVEESLDLAVKDSTARTSLIDLRFLAGSAGFFESFRARAFAEVYRKDVRAFIGEKIEEREKRYRKYGGSVYLLEPNIKEGEGGLRDIHTAHWIARAFYGLESLWDPGSKGVLSPDAAKKLQEKRDFLWRIRNELHFQSDRKNDQLTFEVQERVARALGYRNTRESLGVERFMQDYYRCASEIKQFTSEFVERFVPRTAAGGGGKKIVKGCEVAGGLVTVHRSALPARRVLMIAAFRVARAHGAELSAETKSLIRENLSLIDASFRRDAEVREEFKEILLSGRAFEILQRMNELRVLGRLIPEFARLYYRAQHDIYHVYTVDTHSLFALGELEKLKKGEYRDAYPLLSQVAQQVDDYVSLLLAGLFHDIGKGWGRGHIRTGVKVAPRILSRLGFGRRVRESVVFLIRNHLHMSHVAQRRDLHEEKTIHSFARAMKTQDNLRMLYLLTFADLKAVGPESWTDWRSALLQELYLKAMEELEEGGIREPWRTRQEKKIQAVRDRARRLLKDHPGEFTEEFLEGFHHRYFLVYSPEEIVRHAGVFSGFSGDTPFSVVKDDHPDRGFSEVLLCTKDTPGLLSKIAGVFASNNVNILGVRINVRRDGKVMDTYHITDFQKRAMTDEARWEKVVGELPGVLEGSINVEDLVARRKRPSIIKEKVARRFPTRITVDNRSSDLCTVIDVYTNDRPGLLYDMTSTLHRLGLYIAISKISTKVDQVADVFYVQDLGGRKIMDRKRLDRIVAVLRKAIDEK